MVEDDGMEVVVALFVLQLREGGGTPTMVDDDGVEVVAALFVFSSGKVVALQQWWTTREWKWWPPCSFQLREGGGTHNEGNLLE